MPQITWLRGVWRRLCADATGNVLMMLGFAVIPLTLAIGFGIDYSRAERLQTQLNAIADSAALAAISPQMLCQSSATSNAAALAMFSSQASTLQGISGTNTPTVTINPASSAAGCAGSLRSATVSYTANVKTAVSGIMGIKTLPIGGSAVANASQPPSINFYVALDISQSMLLPTTSAGIASLQAASTNNCTFSCHNQNTTASTGTGTPVRDSAGNTIFLTPTYYNSSVTGAAGVYRLSSGGVVYDGNNNTIGTGGSYSSGALTYNATSGGRPSVSVNYADPFFLAENYGLIRSGGPANIPLRIDAELLAAQSLITKAQTMAATYNATGSANVSYGMQFFKYNVNAPTAINPSMTNVNNLSSASVQPVNGSLAAFYSNNADSADELMIRTMNGLMPNPGTGASSSSPQEMLFIVTDGMQNEMTTNLTGALCQTYYFSNRVCGQPTQTFLDLCTAVKARQITIAILYTQYDPTTINYTSNGEYNYVAANNVPYVYQQLKSCASTQPNGTSLMYTVSANQDIPTALNSLFSMAVQTARLVQ